MDGWISLHRKFLTWEWYDDINTKCLFIHLLLMSNHKELKWRGHTIKRGQRFTSIKSLAFELKLSEKQIRNSLKKLKKTGEIDIQGASVGTMITVCNYGSYQDIENTKGEQKGKRRANKGQAKGEQRATNNNDNKDNNENNDNNNTGLRLFKNDKLYNFDNFKKSFINSKYENADLEFYHEAVMNWADSNGTKKKDWAATARNFMLRDLKDNKLKLKNGVKQITEEDREFNRWVEDNLNN
jgi:hypothetical protein